MKTISPVKKLVVASVVAIALFSTACVDNTESPEVKDLRSAQVEWIKAKTATEKAMADYQTAQTKYQEAKTLQEETYLLKLKQEMAFADSTNKYSLLLKQIDYQVEKAQLNQSLKDAEVAMAKADMDLKTSMAQFEQSVKDSKSEEAAAALNKYQSEVSNLTNLYANKLSQENTIALQKLNMAFDMNNLNTYKKSIQLEITKDSLERAAKVAGLVVLKSVGEDADPASVINAKIKEISQLIETSNLKVIQLSVPKSEATAALNAANKLLSDASSTIRKMEGLKDDLKEFADSIEAKSATIAEFNEEIADINVAIKGYNTALVNARKDSANYATIFKGLEADYNKKLATLTLVTDTLKAASLARDVAQSAYNIALANQVPGKDSTEYKAKLKDLEAKNKFYTEVSTRRQKAYTTERTAYTSYSTAKTNWEKYTDRDINNDDISRNLSNIKSATTSIGNLQTTISESQNLIAKYKLQQTSTNSAITALNASYRTATDNLNKYSLEVTAKQNAVDDLDAQSAVITASIRENEAIIVTLNASLNDLTILKNDIEAKQAAISALEERIARNKINLTVSNYQKIKDSNVATLEKLTKELTAINDKIAQTEKYVATLKAALEKALA